MLNAMRQTAGTKPIKILLLLIVASFALWGVGDMFRSSQTDVAITVGDMNITTARIQQVFEARIAAVQQQNQGELPDFFMGLIKQSVINQMVQQAQLEQFVRDHHITVDDKTVAKAIKENTIFHQDGKFSQERFKQIMAASNLRVSEYEASLRDELSANSIESSVTASIPDLEQQARLIYMLDHSSVSVEALHVTLGSIKKVPEPEANDLNTYYEEHKDDFAAPEYRSFDLLTLTRGSIIEDITVGDEELLTYYKQNQDQFEAPPRLDVEQLLIKDKEKATLLADAMRDGATLAEQKAEDDTLPAEWQLLEDMTEDLLPPQAYRLLASASQPGDIAGPFESAFGQHIFRLKQVKEAGIRPFEEVKDVVRQIVEQEVRDEALNNTMIAFEDKLAAGEALNAAAESMGWKVTRVPALDQEGNALNGRVPDSLEGELKDALLSEIFQLEVGHNVSLKHWPDGTVTAVSLVEVIESRTRALDEVRGLVTEAWKEDKSLEMLQDKAQEISEKAGKGTSLDALAKAHNLDKPKTLSFLRKDSSHDVLPPLCMRLAFMAEAGQISDTCDDGEGGVWLMKVVKTEKADQPDESELTDIKNRLNREVKQERLNMFFGYLSKQYPVKIMTKDQPVDVGAEG